MPYPSWGSSVNGPGEPGPKVVPHHLVEKDKMLRGEPYLHYKDEHLLNERKSCLQAVIQYNDCMNSSKEHLLARQVEFMEQVLKPRMRQDSKHSQPHWGPEGDAGSHTIIEAPFKCDYGYHIHLGKETVVESGCCFKDGGGIFIGDRVIIGEGVKLYTTTPKPGTKMRHGSEGNFEAGSIWIGNDVFIGGGAVIMPFVNIGDGAIVGANSTVTRVSSLMSPPLSWSY